MRNQKQNSRLQQSKGHLFICSMFGNCASSVLSPRTPPGIPDCDNNVAPIFAANGCDLPQQLVGDEYPQCERSEIDLPLSGPVPDSPSASEGDNASSSTSDRTMDQWCGHVNSSIPSDAAASRGLNLEELLAEIKAGNCSKTTVRSLNSKLSKNSQASRELLRASGVASSLISLLLSTNLAVTDGTGARDSVDERHVSHVLEESLSALTLLLEDASTSQLMTTPEFLEVLTWYVANGGRDAKENAYSLLEKLSLIDSFKKTIGASPGVMEALNSTLRDEKHPKLVKLATKTLLALCLVQENRFRAVEVGAVASLLEMLPRTRSATAEKALATLELLGTIEEGKAAIIDHALAVPVLVELILTVSDRGTEYAAGTLSSMCRDDMAMREAAVAHGAPTKLLLLIQSDCTARAKRKANQLLKVLHKLWVQDPCTGGTKAILF